MDIPELGFLMVLALILFGPEELPNMARKLGGIIYDLKKASQEVQQEVRRSVIIDGETPKSGGETTHSDKESTNVNSESTPELIDFSKRLDLEPKDLSEGKEPQEEHSPLKQDFTQDDRN